MTESNQEMEHKDVDQLEIPDELPILPLSDFIVYPLMVLPMFISQEGSVSAMDAALVKDRMILLLAERPGKRRRKKAGALEDFYEIGSAATILKMLKLPDGRIRVIVQGLSRVKIDTVKKDGTHLVAKVIRIPDDEVKADDTEVIAWMRSMRETLERAVSLGKSISPDILMFASSVDDPGRLADLAAATLELDITDSQRILRESDPMKRLQLVNNLYSSELQVLAMQQRISSQAKGEMEKNQREYFLRQQIKAIQQELGDIGEYDEEIFELRERLKKAKMPPAALVEAERQLEKLDRMHPDAAEASVIRNYLDVMADLPWSRKTKDRLDLVRAKQILDEDHYDLEKVKERILEHLGVMKLRKSKMRGPILCFVGPPGVGKTSLGRSIARALNRKFVRLSLGGVRDEAEIRGHRRTYVGALPGRVVQGIAQVRFNNPVFMMDEVDKLGADFRGDPSSALLEVLDPEQNSTFRDNYLGVEFDLSNVMFILTANRIDTIQPAFRDRMEILEIPGYTEEEKIQIAKKHLLPKQRSSAGITANQLKLDDSALSVIIKSYTSEAGVRNLEREIATICRKVARKVAEGTRGRNLVTADNAHEFLGPEKILPNQMLDHDTVGVATGLAWTPSGGDVLFIEAILMNGKGLLTLTGQLGEVMQESAKAALSFAKANAAELGFGGLDLSGRDIHIHVPEGSIPKDGPSAGVSMTTALISAFSGRPVRSNVAMTGEITLRGRVMPVGGIKEKVLAARRIGIMEIILPRQNEKDLIEIQNELKKDLVFRFVSNIKEVIDIALQQSPMNKLETPV